jgi:hypothetical protein
MYNFRWKVSLGDVGAFELLNGSYRAMKLRNALTCLVIVVSSVLRAMNFRCEVRHMRMFTEFEPEETRKKEILAHYYRAWK